VPPVVLSPFPVLPVAVVQALLPVVLSPFPVLPVAVVQATVGLPPPVVLSPFPVLPLPATALSPLVPVVPERGPVLGL